MAAAFTVAIASAASAQTPEGGYDVRGCPKCHGKLLKQKVVHAAVKGGDCSNCHVPASGGGKCKGISPAWALKKPGPELCGGCHDKSGDTAMHKAIEMRGCVGCHDPHGSAEKKLLKVKADVLCDGCHRRPNQNKYVHTAVKQGKCVGCHEPHSGVTDPLLREERVDLCATCHDAKKLFPKGSKHPPVEKGRCLECHAPHGSQLPFQLREDGNALCLKCHAAGAKSPSGEPAATKVIDFSLKVHKPVQGDCLDCHVRTHSSQVPKLLKKPGPELCGGCHDMSGDAPMHPVIAQQGCTACHEPHQSGEKKLLKLPKDKLCQSCHPEQAKAGAGSTHPPVAQGNCLGCHDPHSGAEKPLLIAARAELCAECHKDQDKLSPLPNKHPPVGEARCLECHQPHQSAQPKLLVAAGRELCIRCHLAGAKRPSGEPAATKTFDPTKKLHTPVKEDDCQQCHVQTHSSALPKLLKAASLDLCLKCHGEQVQGNTPLHTVIQQKGCTVCHDAHQSSFKPNLKVDKAQLCLQCHADHAKGAVSSHPPAAEGNCLGCHNPHSGEDAPLLITTKRELCFECHDKAEVLGTSPVMHAPVVEGRCPECHKPHGSDQPKLLVASGKALCLKCHQAGPEGDPTVLEPRRIQPAQKVPHPPVSEGDCQLCHEQKHGGSVRALLKKAPPELCYGGGCHERKDTAKFVHGAVKLGDCPTCHMPHGSDFPKLVRYDKPSRICFDCHQDDLTGRKAIHKPTQEKEECLSCHDPHGAGAPDNLKIGQGKDACLSCHPRKDEGKVQHAALVRYGCTACHDPHGTANGAQLLKPVNAVCQQCHKDKTDGLHATAIVRGGHTVSGPIDPRRKGRGFTCASCHNPHGSDNPNLFYAGADAMEMCQGCHGDKTGKNKEMVDLVSALRAELAQPSDGGVPMAGQLQSASVLGGDGGTPIGSQLPTGAPRAEPLLHDAPDGGRPDFSVRR